MEIAEKKVEESKGKPGLLIGIIPCYNELFVQAAWSIIKDEVEKLASASMGEYTAYQIYQKVFFGQAHLYMGFIDYSGKFDDEHAQAYVGEKVLKQEKEDFAGYMIVQMDSTAVHLLQGYVNPKFADLDILEMAIKFIKEKAKSTGAPYLSFSTFRKGWEGVAKNLGFVEGPTTYRLDLKK